MNHDGNIMSAFELIKEIKALPPDELQRFLETFLNDQEIVAELERLGLLTLTEKAFDFWNDPREDIYQDYLKRDQSL